jgi:hypothetical protein
LANLSLGQAPTSAKSESDLVHFCHAAPPQGDGHSQRPAHAKAPAKTAQPDGSVKAVLEAIVALDINQLSPVEALTKLYELQRRLIGMYQDHEMKRGAKIF